MPTVNYGIAASSDDTSGGPGLGGFDPAVIIHGDASAFGLGLVYAGLRFNGVAVPQGATITSATLTVKQNSATPIFGAASSGTAWGTIKGVDLDDAPLWTTTNPQVTTKTTASVAITNSATVAYAVTGIVQEIVDRAGWVSGNDLAFATDPTGANGHMEWIDRLASSTDCAQLEITYSAGGGGSYTIDGAATGTGTATGETAPGPRPITGDATGTGLATGDFVAPLRSLKVFRAFPRFQSRSPVWLSNAQIIVNPEFWDAAPSGGTSYTIDGAANGLGTATGLVLRTAPVSGVAAGLAVATGLAGRSAPVVGGATGTGTATGDVGTQGGADGAATGTGTATGSVGVSKPLTGTASGSGAATGAVLRLATINGVAVGTGTATGAVGRTASVTGAASGTGTASGETGYTGAPEPDPSGSNWMIDRRRRRSAVR